MTPNRWSAPITWGQRLSAGKGHHQGDGIIDSSTHLANSMASQIAAHTWPTHIVAAVTPKFDRNVDEAAWTMDRMVKHKSYALKDLVLWAPSLLNGHGLPEVLDRAMLDSCGKGSNIDACSAMNQ